MSTPSTPVTAAVAAAKKPTIDLSLDDNGGDDNGERKRAPKKRGRRLKAGRVAAVVGSYREESDDDDNKAADEEDDAFSSSIPPIATRVKSAEAGADDSDARAGSGSGSGSGSSGTTLDDPAAEASVSAFPALSDPFDAGQEPASAKEARAVISTAMSTALGGQLLPESAFLWLSSIVLSSKIPSRVRASAFAALAKVTAAVVHVPDLCVSGNLARVYLERIVVPVAEGTCAMNEDLNNLLHVLDIMFAEDKTGATDSTRLLTDFVGGRPSSGDETAGDGGGDDQPESLCAQLVSTTRRAISTLEKEHKGKGSAAVLRKTALDRLRRFVRLFRLHGNGSNEAEAEAEPEESVDSGASSAGKSRKSGKSDKLGTAKSDKPGKSAKGKRSRAEKTLPDRRGPDCPEPASEAKYIGLVMRFESGNQRLMSKEEIDMEPDLLAVRLHIVCTLQLYLDIDPLNSVAGQFRRTRPGRASGQASR